MTSSFAQGSSVPNTDKGCEDAVDELKVRRIEVDGLRQQVALLGKQSEDKDKLIIRLDEIAVFWKEAATTRKDALDIDDRIERIRMEQIVEYKEEINRLRIENEKLRRSRTKWFLGGVILGAVAPKFP